ncbi:cellulose biosynthesis protein BcsC [Xanthomonas floridensis]|uniref:Cellulose synthase n=1 Tax=Xanthomonas floridensis TaxID=1843580 RepID=A0A1A9M6A3_9XANT|nr:cellulose biosynthesis protein BcsC [Xanthomonas floridensis]MEA5123981.1 cellulose synthase subunit BcsC-related outer membrane protein [Xanthomonas floridensis]MEA5131667.1 cellulose synthase subunit BcsC-related outer membrane protein [Xanthomonas floridensis]OAG65456.1 cellulose synthase [Xanthomonas floridensis]
MLRKNLTPLYLAGMIDLCLLASPVHAQTGATQQLVGQGNYWHDQGRDDLAADTWKKLLGIDPDQPDALLGLAQIDLAQGRQSEARKRLQQLEAAHPQSPQAQRLRVAIGARGSATAGEDPNLRNARRASAAGRYVEAARSYEAVFAGKAPPPNLALEYYQSLAGTPTGWERARDGLRKLQASEPGNPSLQLALAQVLSYREPTRREGIAQLRTLAQRADVGGPARISWRQALLWLNANTADAPLYQAFLAGTPNDAEVTAKLGQLSNRRSAETTPADPNGIALGEGFRALNAGNLGVAEQRFTQVLRARARDPEALGGLGSVRLRQQRFSEAQELLRPAAASNGKWKPALDSARYWQQLQQAEAARARGDLAQARQLVEQSVQLLPNEPAGHVALGGLQAAGDPVAAEASYRKALSRDADNAGALQGLVGLYSRQGRMQEATELFNRLPAAERAKSGGQALLRSNVQRARARQSLDAGDAVSAQAELEAAMVERPGDAWIRLDLARLYQQAGRPDQARSVMDGLLAVHADQPEALHANALFAQESGDWQGVYDSLDRIPVAARTPEMTQLRTTAWIELQARQARLLVEQGRVGEAQQLLARTETALGNQLDDPQLLAALAGAHADAGNAPRALVLAQRLVTGANPRTEDRLQYAGVLLRAQQDAELSAVLRQLQSTTMTPEQLRRYQSLRSAYTLRQVDALRELGNLEGAFDALSPILAQQPDNRDAQAALARLYAAAGDQPQALALYQQILQRHPDDLDTLTAAANSAAAQSDLRNAERYLQRALAQAPESPEVLAAAGRVYRSAGKNRKAEQYFRASLAAQQRQAGQLDNGLPAARGPAVVVSSGRPLNPFSGMTGGMPRSPAVLSERMDTGSDYAQTALAPLPTQPAAARFAAPVPAPVTAGADAYAGNSADALPPPVSASAAPSVLPAPASRSRLPARSVPTLAPADAPRPRGVAAQALPAASSGNSGNSVLDELRAVQSENSDNLAGGALYRSRDGEDGLGRLDDIEMPVQAEFAVGEGKLGVTLTPTVVDAGTLTTDYATASRFGTGPQTAVNDALAADRSPIDTLTSSSVYQLLATQGNTAATRERLRRYALTTGLFGELLTENNNSTPAALAALANEPLPAYLLSVNASNTPIAQLARDILSNTAISEQLAAGDGAALQALASSSAAAQQTPTSLAATLNSMAATGNGARRLSQDDTGVGVGVRYRNGGFSADVGSTPIGFQEQNIVGGVGYRGELGETVSWSADASRRAVTDSVLSFAGAQDGRSGREWGGVTSSGVVLSATADNGLLGGYANLAAHRLTGNNVADNDHRQADLGFYVHALETRNQSLTAGVNLTAMQYDKNLSGFTYGHGGYFSPQEYVDLGFPVHWSGRSAGQSVNWKVDASVGVQHFKTDPTPYFPTDPTLQQAAYDAASLAALLGLVERYTDPVYAGESRTGVSYNLSGAAEWRVAPQLFLGGRMTFNNARDYNQFSSNLYLRFVMDRLGAALGRAPQVLTSPYAADR